MSIEGPPAEAGGPSYVWALDRGKMGFDSRLERSVKHSAKPRKQSLLLVAAAVFAVAILLLRLFVFVRGRR